MNEDGVSLFYGIRMDFDGVCPVFFRIAFSYCFSWQFSRFPAHDKTCSEFSCQGCSHDESPGFYSYNFRYVFVGVSSSKLIQHFLETSCIFEECAYVLELYARLGKIRNVS